MGRASRLSLASSRTADQVDDARLRGMAAKIQDEQHWRTILETCPTQADRDSLEAVLGPILPFRCCGNKACASGEPPIWAPVLLFRVYPGGPTSRVTVLLRVCYVCRETITLDDVLTDDTWDRVREACDEKAADRPDRALTTLTFDALQ